jgi:hypothetical protein
MTGIQHWKTSDELTTISACSEGCIHLRVGRAIIKLLPEEFFALTKLANTALREMQLRNLPVGQRSGTGH